MVVDVHALEIKTDVETVTADQDNKITATLKENEVMQKEKCATMLMCTFGRIAVLSTELPICMMALVMAGSPILLILLPTLLLLPQYLKEEDLNNDGKISFRDYETEIIGTYDLATNTWNGGVIDARTFQRNNGEYVFDLSETNGARVNTVGIDFGGAKGVPDHVISDFESITHYDYCLQIRR